MAHKPTFVSNKQLHRAADLNICERCNEPTTKFDRARNECDQCADVELSLNGDLDYEAILYNTD